MTTPLPTLTKEEKKRKICPPPILKARSTHMTGPHHSLVVTLSTACKLGSSSWFILSMLAIHVVYCAQARDTILKNIFLKFQLVPAHTKLDFYVKHIPQIHFQTK